MKLHQQLLEDSRERQSKTNVYSSVNFGDKFFSFLESLENAGIYTTDFNRQRTDLGTVWNDHVRTGGIKLMTEFHPSINDGKAGTVTISGSPMMLNVVDSTMDRYTTG